MILRCRFWEILKLIDQGKVKDGQRFEGIDTPINLILEYDEKEKSLVYVNIMGNKSDRNAVTCCCGELETEYESIIE